VVQDKEDVKANSWKARVALFSDILAAGEPVDESSFEVILKKLVEETNPCAQEAGLRALVVASPSPQSLSRALPQLAKKFFLSNSAKVKDAFKAQLSNCDIKSAYVCLSDSLKSDTSRPRDTLCLINCVLSLLHIYGPIEVSLYLKDVILALKMTDRPVREATYNLLVDLHSSGVVIPLVNIAEPQIKELKARLADPKEIPTNVSVVRSYSVGESDDKADISNLFALDWKTRRAAIVEISSLVLDEDDSCPEKKSQNFQSLLYLFKQENSYPVNLEVMACLKKSAQKFKTSFTLAASFFSVCLTKMRNKSLAKATVKTCRALQEFCKVTITVNREVSELAVDRMIRDDFLDLDFRPILDAHNFVKSIMIPCLNDVERTKAVSVFKELITEYPQLNKELLNQFRVLGPARQKAVLNELCLEPVTEVKRPSYVPLKNITNRVSLSPRKSFLAKTSIVAEKKIVSRRSSGRFSDPVVLSIKVEPGSRLKREYHERMSTWKPETMDEYSLGCFKVQWKAIVSSVIADDMFDINNLSNILLAFDRFMVVPLELDETEDLFFKWLSWIFAISFDNTQLWKAALGLLDRIFKVRPCSLLTEREQSILLPSLFERLGHKQNSIRLILNHFVNENLVGRPEIIETKNLLIFCIAALSTVKSRKTIFDLLQIVSNTLTFSTEAASLKAKKDLLRLVVTYFQEFKQLCVSILNSLKDCTPIQILDSIAQEMNINDQQRNVILMILRKGCREYRRSELRSSVSPRFSEELDYEYQKSISSGEYDRLKNDDTVTRDLVSVDTGEIQNTLVHLEDWLDNSLVSAVRNSTAVVSTLSRCLDKVTTSLPDLIPQVVRTLNKLALIRPIWYSAGKEGVSECLVTMLEFLSSRKLRKSHPDEYHLVNISVVHVLMYADPVCVLESLLEDRNHGGLVLKCIEKVKKNLTIFLESERNAYLVLAVLEKSLKSRADSRIVRQVLEGVRDAIGHEDTANLIQSSGLVEISYL
jgi:hypothetical protein